jgi:hypothetical protein
MNDVTGLLKAAAVNWVHDHAQSMGAALASYTMFSIAPLLLIVIAVAGTFVGKDSARSEILRQLSGLLGGPGLGAVESMLEDVAIPAEHTLTIVLGAGFCWTRCSRKVVPSVDWPATCHHDAPGGRDRGGPGDLEDPHAVPPAGKRDVHRDRDRGRPL